MTSRRYNYYVRFCLVLLAVLIAMPVIATWRVLRQERLNRALIVAVKANDDKAAESLLEQGADSNCRDEPPRRFSFWQTLMEIVRGRPNRPSDAPTPLLIALKVHAVYLDPPLARLDFLPEDVPLVRALLDHGAHIDQTDEYGSTALLEALQSQKNATILLLLSRGASLKPRADPDNDPLIAAVYDNCDTDIIAAMLDRGADVNYSNGDSSALTAAIRTQNDDMVRLLIHRHADVTLRAKGKTPLEWATPDNPQSSRQIIRLLKAAGAQP